MASRRLLRLAVPPLLLLLLALPARAASSSASGSQACARESTALTSACLGRCYNGRPCIAYAAGAGAVDCEPTAFSACVDTDSGCALECFTNGPDDLVANGAVGFSAYTFLVPFADEDGEDDEAAASSDTDALPSKTNAVLSRVEALSLLTVTTKASIIGGASVDGAVTRGRTAEMQLVDGFLADNAQLEDITLANLALRSVAAGALPTTAVANLTLRNCLLSAPYPADLSSMASLVRLDVSLNLLTDFPSSLRLPALQTLNLSANALESFRGVLPSLVSLDLSGNALTSIPTSVFALPSLRRLFLRDNRLAAAQLVLSQSQLAFLSGLAELSTDSLGDTSSCPAAQLVSVHGVSACALVASADSSTASASASADGSASSSNSTTSSAASKIATIVGASVGGIVVVLALFAALAARVHRQSKSRARARGLTPDANAAVAVAPYRPPPPTSDAHEAELDAAGLRSWRVDAGELQWLSRDVSRGSRCVVDLAAFRRHHSRAGRALFPGAVAVRRLRADLALDPAARADFAAELSVLARMQHPRVTALLGLLWPPRGSGEAPAALVEFLEGGSLRAWLAGLLAAGEDCAWSPAKAQLALDVAAALAHAHAMAPPVVHARLRSDKVLLSADARAKLGHWRAAEPGADQRVAVAPELLAATAPASPASDAFALGLLLAELETHRAPPADASLVRHARGASVLESSGNLRPLLSASKADGLPRELRAVALRCLAVDPAARASAADVAAVLRALVA